MNEIRGEKWLSDQIDAWSDGSLAHVEDFVNLNRSLLSRGIGMNQLHGMRAALNNGIPLFFEFMKNRELKARRSGQFDVEKFYSDLIKEVNRVLADADVMTKEVVSVGGKVASLETIRPILVGKFLQHVIAQTMYATNV